MNKTARLTLIRERFNAKFEAPVPGVLPVHPVEVAKTARAVKAKVEKAMDDSTASGDEVTLSSQLQFDKPEIKVDRDTDILLTPEEKKELAKVWSPRAKVAAPASIETEHFAGQNVEEFQSVINKDWDIELADEIAAGTRWELDLIESQKFLLLMA